LALENCFQPEGLPGSSMKLIPVNGMMLQVCKQNERTWWKN